MIYLDNAAQSEIKSEVLSVIIDSLKNDWCNPSAQYDAGIRVKEKIEEARKIVASKINAELEEIIFTSSGCEANSFFSSNEWPNTFIADGLSHASIYDQLYINENKIKCDKNGFIDIVHLEELLKNNLAEINMLNELSNCHMFGTRVSINAGNNEIGTIQDIKAISKLVHKYNSILHVDAVQLFADRYIDVKELGIDMMTISGHKIGTPSGIAALYVKKGLDLSPIIFGKQENGLRGGTENAPYIIGFGKACELLRYDEESFNKRIELRDYLINKLIKLPNTFLVGAKGNNRLSNNINICFEGIDATSMINYLDLADVCVSGGSACNSFAYEPSHVLESIGLNENQVHCCVRFTISNTTTIEELNYTIKCIRRYVEMLEDLKSKNKQDGKNGR